MSLDVKSLLKNVVDNNLIQRPDGSFPPGNNGPHGDQETPVRTTAHVLYILCWLIDQGDDLYISAAHKAVDYLLSQPARPMGAAFWCRFEPGKDFCNGLIGQAWVIESLVKAYGVLGREDCLSEARAVLRLHCWEEQASAWRCLNVDGSYGNLCKTFNQQLWFAYVASMFSGEEELLKMASLFVDNVLPRVDLYRDGVIFHDSTSFDFGTLSKRSKKVRVKLGVGRAKRYLQWRIQRERSVGYHAFNLVALAGLKVKFPENDFWKTKKFKNISESIFSSTYKDECRKNMYSPHYNPVGFEEAYFLDVTGGGEKAVRQSLMMQYESIDMSGSGGIKITGSYDYVNSLARLYEVCRIPFVQGVSK